MKHYNENSEKRSIANVELGNDVKIYDFVNAYSCSIGDRSKIGTFVEIQKNSKIGVDCKISSHSFICEGVQIGDGVFIGHGVMFINDLYPRATNDDGSMQTDSDWEVLNTIVKASASIGSNATILAGVTIGKRSIVGAGSVVTKDVPEGVIVAGNPAKIIREI